MSSLLFFLSWGVSVAIRCRWSPAYYDRWKKRWLACLLQVFTPGWLTSIGCCSFPGERSFPSSFWLKTINTNEYLVGHAGLHKLQGLTQEAKANIFLVMQNQGVLGDTGIFYIQFYIPESSLESQNPPRQVYNWAEKKGRC